MTPSKQDEKELLEESVWGPEPKKSEFQERWDSLDWESIQSQR
jgi:hypothetical protein